MIDNLITKTGSSYIIQQPEMTTLKGNINNLPNLFKSNAYVIIMITAGKLMLSLDKNDYCLNKYDILFIPPGTLCEFNTSCYCSIYSCSFSSAYIEESLNSSTLMNLRVLFINPSVTILSPSEQQFFIITCAYDLLEDKLKDKNVRFCTELQQLSFNLLIAEITEVYTSQKTTDKINRGKNVQLAKKFFKILKINVRKQHKVSFYANALCVTSGHLSKVIKQVENRSVKQIIEQELITEAKILLYNSKLSILDITEELEFGNTSFFCSFFKKHTAYTPTQYRRTVSIED